MRFLDIDLYSQEIDSIDEKICNDELVLDYVSSLVENYYTDRITSISEYFAEHDDDCYEVTECLKWEILTSDREYSKEDRMFYITVVESEIFKYIDIDEREYTIEDDFESQWSFDFYQDIDRAD